MDQCFVAVHDTGDGRETLTIPVETSQVLAVVFAPDGSRLACSSRGNGVRLYDLGGNQLAELPTAEQCWTVAFSADGKQLATGTWGRVIEIFDLATGQRRSVLEGHAGTVWSIHWPVHDPRLLYSAAADGRVRLWDVAARQVLLTLEPFGSGYDALAVHATPDGRRFAAAGASPTAFVWDVDYYERHIAGNVEAQLERLPAEPAGAARIRTWAREVLARPWPRR
jgi:WD40 repeat protein